MDNSMVVSEGRAKLQFTLQKIGIAWSFCMVVASFNRVAVTDLGLPAAAISLLIGVYTLFGPIQPVIGRMAERWPLFRYRRTPYMLIGTLRMEIGDSIKIVCSKTDMETTINFQQKPYFGGASKLNSLVGKVCRAGKELYSLEGHWDNIMYITPKGGKKE